MHPLVQYNLPATPRWAEEGIPSFFEKFYGYRGGTNLILTFGFQNPWRIKELGTNIPALNLKRIVASEEGVGTSEKRMVAMFLFKQGLFKKHLDLIMKNQKRGYGTFIEASFEKRFSDIEPLWKTYLNETYQQSGNPYASQPSISFQDCI